MPDNMTTVMPQRDNDDSDDDDAVALTFENTTTDTAASSMGYGRWVHYLHTGGPGITLHHQMGAG